MVWGEVLKLAAGSSAGLQNALSVPTGYPAPEGHSGSAVSKVKSPPWAGARFPGPWTGVPGQEGRSCSTCLAPVFLQAHPLIQNSLCCVARPSPGNIFMWLHPPSSPILKLVPWTYVWIKTNRTRLSISPFTFVLTLYRDARNCQNLPSLFVLFYWHLCLQINICINDWFNSGKFSIDLGVPQSIVTRLFKFSHSPQAIWETFFPFIWWT